MADVTFGGKLFLHERREGKKFRNNAAASTTREKRPARVRGRPCMLSASSAASARFFSALLSPTPSTPPPYPIGGMVSRWGCEGVPDKIIRAEPCREVGLHEKGPCAKIQPCRTRRFFKSFHLLSGNGPKEDCRPHNLSRTVYDQTPLPNSDRGDSKNSQIGRKGPYESGRGEDQVMVRSGY